MGQIQTRNVFGTQNGFNYPDYLRREYIDLNSGNNGGGSGGNGGNSGGGSAGGAVVPIPKGLYSSYANPNPNPNPVYAGPVVTSQDQNGHVTPYQSPNAAPGQVLQNVGGNWAQPMRMGNGSIGYASQIAFNDHANAPIIGVPNYGSAAAPMVAPGPRGPMDGGVMTDRGFFGAGNVPAPPPQRVSPEDMLAAGGKITEPILGVGLHSGKHYTFGEAGDETVTPDNAERGQQYVKQMAQNQKNSQNLATGARGYQQRTFLPNVTERIGGGEGKSVPPPFQFNLGGRSFTTFSDSSGQRHVRDDATGNTMPVGGIQDRGIGENGVISDSTVVNNPTVTDNAKVIDSGPTLDDLLGNTDNGAGNNSAGPIGTPPPPPPPQPPQSPFGGPEPPPVPGPITTPIPPAPIPPAPQPPQPIDNGPVDQPPTILPPGPRVGNPPPPPPPPPPVIPTDTGTGPTIVPGDTSTTTPPPPSNIPQPQPPGTPVTGAGVGDFSVIPNVAAPGTFTGSIQTPQQQQSDILGGADTSAGARGRTTGPDASVDPSIFGPTTLSPDELQAFLTQ